eukprot:CAMPEP_0115381034 /NCGR_PEP_ID=MMETSP0271-20121206/5357_1 /TAXON_ID=71861 /ORGANISM="Scrippsiella trochoidea, Strain CCMP3099" /LENGTH=235 /DNA_ID=CAMNT_0002804291 /DNA_START=479 /DNA_END=1187 /DNA_ORIENTATION=-
MRPPRGAHGDRRALAAGGLAAVGLAMVLAAVVVLLDLEIDRAGDRVPEGVLSVKRVPERVVRDDRELLRLGLRVLQVAPALGREPDAAPLLLALGADLGVLLIDEACLVLRLGQAILRFWVHLAIVTSVAGVVVAVVLLAKQALGRGLDEEPALRDLDAAHVLGALALGLDGLIGEIPEATHMQSCSPVHVESSWSSFVPTSKRLGDQHKCSPPLPKSRQSPADVIKPLAGQPTS